MARREARIDRHLMCVDEGILQRAQARRLHIGSIGHRVAQKPCDS
jgi:hypothetical protein